MSDQNCIFCQIISNTIPSTRLYEDELCLAILDIFPVSKGHTLVFPKMHFSTLEDLENDLLSHIFKIVKKLATLIRIKLKVDGYNVIQNNFSAAGQAIKHFHVHIIPRMENDSKLKINIPKEQISIERLEILKKKILN